MLKQTSGSITAAVPESNVAATQGRVPETKDAINLKKCKKERDAGRKFTQIILGMKWVIFSRTIPDPKLEEEFQQHLYGRF